MVQVAILSRRLKEGKTYEDFRKAWYHTVGFGTNNKMYTVINAFDPREIIVIGFTDTELKNFPDKLQIDLKERLEHSLDEVIEPEISKKFGLLVSEDDFSAIGSLGYKPPAVHGVETNLEQFEKNLLQIAEMISQATNQQDSAKKAK